MMIPPLEKSLRVSNSMNKICADLYDILDANYIATIKFTQSHVNTGHISVNGKTLCYRLAKHSSVKFHEDVIEYIGTPTKFGGSNNHPEPSFEEGFVIIKFRCKGFPTMTSWNLIRPELIDLVKID